MHKKLWVSLFGFLACQCALFSECSGKLDLGPAYVHIDVLQSGRTVKSMNLAAAKGDLALVWENGFAIKAGFLDGGGSGSIVSGNAGIGWYIPVKMFISHPWAEKICFLPTVGYSSSSLHARIRENVEDAIPAELRHQLGISNTIAYHEKFRSGTPYLNLDVTYSISPKLKLTGIFQWGWARTHTHLTASKGFKKKVEKHRDELYALFGGHTLVDPNDPNRKKFTKAEIEEFEYVYGEANREANKQVNDIFDSIFSANFKGNSQGPSYGLLLDYIINDNWSVNVGGAYNITLSREKHGLRAAGAKVGVAYWF